MCAPWRTEAKVTRQQEALKTGGDARLPPSAHARTHQLTDAYSRTCSEPGHQKDVGLVRVSSEGTSLGSTQELGENHDLCAEILEE